MKIGYNYKPRKIKNCGKRNCGNRGIPVCTNIFTRCFWNINDTYSYNYIKRLDWKLWASTMKALWMLQICCLWQPTFFRVFLWYTFWTPVKRVFLQVQKSSNLSFSQKHQIWNIKRLAAFIHDAQIFQSCPLVWL